MSYSIEDIFKNKGGRPPKYTSVKKLQDKIVEYFNIYQNLDNLEEQENQTEQVKKYLKEKANKKTIGKSIYGKSPTITGLTLFLGYASRQSFYDNIKNEKFSYILNKALLFIESNYEEQLTKSNCTGIIFALKNMGWTDKQEIEQTGAPTIKVIDMSPGYTPAPTEENDHE